jgi:hypothetical protein
MCPSSSPDVATVMIGVRRPGRSPELLDAPMTVPDEIRTATWAGRHVRFAGPCHASACDHWDEGCSLGRHIAEEGSGRAELASPCGIRDRCRWFAENGPLVCGPCGSVMRLR